MGGDTLMRQEQVDEDGIRVRSILETTARKGDIGEGIQAEYYAVTWLWDRGYEVFKNAGCNGPIDLVAIKEGETILVDVKTIHIDQRAKNNGRTIRKTRSEEQKKLGVVFLAFDPDTLKLRWVETH
jgi:Holliday junction resolvase-like predicted endonuclease